MQHNFNTKKHSHKTNRCFLLAERISKCYINREILSELWSKLLISLSVYYDTKTIQNINLDDFVENFELYFYQMIKRDKEEDNIIEKAKVYMKENYYKDISVSDIAQNVYLSGEYFGRYFKKVTGQSINLFLLDIRMKKSN